MGFESGGISFRIYSVPRDFPEDVCSRFAAHAALPLDSLKEGQNRGWVTGRHLLDRNITEENAYYGGFLRLALQIAERKVPASLLQAECKMEEMAVLAAEGRAFLNKQQRADIKKSVIERLLPKMPPQIKGLPILYDHNELVVYASSVSAQQSDVLVAALQAVLGFVPLPLTPDVVVPLRKKGKVSEWYPVSYSPEIGPEGMAVLPGREFLTWLWFVAECRGGVVTLPSGEVVSLMLEGPLTFAYEGDGAHETVLRRGQPLTSVEAKTCLLAGKKLIRAKLTLAMDEDQWQTTLDADEFVFRGLSLPKITDFMDSISNFQERMRRLDLFRNMFFSLYDIFAEERRDPSVWKTTVDDIHSWVKNREGRK